MLGTLREQSELDGRRSGAKALQQVLEGVDRSIGQHLTVALLIGISFFTGGLDGIDPWGLPQEKSSFHAV